MSNVQQGMSKGEGKGEGEAISNIQHGISNVQGGMGA